VRNDGAVIWQGNSYLRTADGQIFRAEGAKDVAADRSFPFSGNACVVRQDGTIWCWGDNFLGQLGAGTMGPSATPLQVVKQGGAPLTGAERVAVDSLGNEFCAIAEGGKLYCWGTGGTGSSRVAVEFHPDGLGRNGQMGTQSADAIDVSMETWTAVLKRDGTVWLFGTPMGNPVQAPFTAPMSQIACGNGYCCAITREGGELWCVRSGFGTELLVEPIVYVPGSPVRDVATISEGLLATTVVFADRTVYKFTAGPARMEPLSLDSTHQVLGNPRFALTAPLVVGSRCVVTEKTHQYFSANRWEPFCE
jgi:hypothetical protein